MKKSKETYLKTPYRRIVDFFMILCFVLSIFLNWKYLDKFENFNSIVAVDIIISLLPTVITVVSICLSIPKEKIYGIEINEFNKIRCSFVYKFLEMMIIAILIFASCFIVKLLNFSLSIIVLNCISLIYSFYFCVQEIPIMVKNDGRLMSVVLHYLKNDKNIKPIYYYDEDNKIARILTYLMFYRGPLFIIKSFKDNRPDIVYSLLEAQNSFLYKLRKNISSLKIYPNDEFEGIEILKAFNKSYENIIEIFRNNNDIKYLDCCISNENNIVSLTRPLYYLHYIAHSIGLEKTEKDYINHLLWTVYCIKQNDEIAVFQFLNAMLMSNISNGDLWFLKAIRDVDFPDCFFELDGNVYGYFALMYICFAIKSGMFSETTVQNINNCLNEKSQSINGSASLLTTALRGIEYVNDYYVLKMILKLLKIYDSSNETRFYIESDNNKNEVLSDLALFKKEDLFNYWLELILFNPYVYLKSNDFIEILDQFSVKDKESFFSLIDKEWINNNGLKDNDHTSFLKFLGIRFTIGINYRNEEIIDLLKKERNDYFSYAENKRINNSIINDTEFGKYKKKIGDSFKKTINDYSLLDKSLDLLNAEKMYYSILIETENLDSFIDMNIKQLANAISNLMRIRLLKSNIKKTNLKDYIFSNEEINDVIAFNPDLMSSHSSIFYKCDSEQKKYFEKVSKINDHFIPNNLFWKNNAIRINVEYCDGDSTFRKLTAIEINDKIEREYEKVGTLYKYTRFSNTDLQSFLVTREKLEELLSKRYLVCIIVFKQELSIKEDAILYYNYDSIGRS